MAARQTRLHAPPAAREPVRTAPPSLDAAVDRALLAVACAGSAILLIVLGTRLAFFNDDWEFLLNRPGLSASTLLEPHNGHLSVLSVLIHKSLVALFGLDAQLPFRVVLAAMVCAVAVVLHHLVAARAGRVAGLCAAGIVLFLGPASEDLLWAFQIGFVGSLAAGLAALLAVERRTRRGDAAACALLFVAIGLSDAGVPFIVAAAVALVLQRRPRDLWIAAVPAIVFAAWYLTYGVDSPSGLSWTNVAHLPRYVVDAASIGLASATGLNRSAHALDYGHALLGIAIAGAALSAWRRRLPPIEVLVPGSAALAFWVLTGANFTPGRAPIAGRYQLVDAALLILLAAAWVRPVRPGRRATIVLVVLTGCAVASNASALRGGYQFMRGHADIAKADLGALQIARDRVAPGFALTPVIAEDPFLFWVTAGAYFDAVDAHGPAPALSPAELRAGTPAQRSAADHVLVAAYAPRLDRVPGDRAASGCARAGGPAEALLPRAAVTVTNLRPQLLVLSLRRFGDAGTVVPFGFLAARSTARLAIPVDRVALPWRLSANLPGSIAVCRG